MISSSTTNFGTTFKSRKAVLDFRQLCISDILQSQSQSGKGAERIKVYTPDFAELQFRVLFSMLLEHCSSKFSRYKVFSMVAYQQGLQIQ